MVFSAIWRYLASPVTALTANEIRVCCAENASILLTLVQHLRHIDRLRIAVVKRRCRKKMGEHIGCFCIVVLIIYIWEKMGLA